MATKLTFKSEVDYKVFDSNETENIEMKFYNEKDDSLKWTLEKFCLFLLANGYPEEIICKFINYDSGEVLEIGEE